ncbi:SnoaL-like protein [Kribbella sp. VKM Ac-2571]|uniref:nuclear transport factor 2 family protein n=1 Tax=Kribbella sp. VKM Ac-2571 TaxID=2512222 RepID=UPI0010F2E0EC|nr:nuclear transport factor 2 family protein [Kribbella sp. VKM Ac-2571]TDO55079.1 SnoaL-like protein [Kribbella sp. VKM Ac-2571]
MKISAVAAVAVALVGCSGSNPGAAPAPTTVDVLPAVQAYVDAVNRRDLDGLVNAFHTDGRIVDVSRTIAGQDAIRTWARNEVIGGSLQALEVVERRPTGQNVLVRWAPAGSDGWLAHYDFTSDGGASRSRTCSTPRRGRRSWGACR